MFQPKAPKKDPHGRPARQRKPRTADIDARLADFRAARGDEPLTFEPAALSLGSIVTRSVVISIAAALAGAIAGALVAWFAIIPSAVFEVAIGALLVAALVFLAAAWAMTAVWVPRVSQRAAVFGLAVAIPLLVGAGWTLLS